MNSIILKWKDKQGGYHEKDYGHNATAAEKARRWLANNGAEEIDVAMRVTKPQNTLASE